MRGVDEHTVHGIVVQVRRALRKMHEVWINAAAQLFCDQTRSGFEEVFAAIAAAGARLVSWDDEKKGKKKGDKNEVTGKPHVQQATAAVLA